MTENGHGKKFNVCRKKGIPAVKTEWLSACMGNGRIVDVTPFIVQPAGPGPVATQTQTLPNVLEATQAELLPQPVSQGMHCHLRGVQCCAGLVSRGYQQRPYPR
jgi:hypothetical protein